MQFKNKFVESHT